MIIQTGMRTDIPAFYSKWFLNRIKEGYVCVRNPYDPKQVTKYSLSPEVVDLIAFCTKNPLPMLPFIHLRQLSIADWKFQRERKIREMGNVHVFWEQI